MSVTAAERSAINTPPTAAHAARPRVVVDLEKLRHINCGLGRFSLHLGRELLSASENLFKPVFLMPRGAQRYFPESGYGRLTVGLHRKEVVQRLVRPLVRPFLPTSSIALWHVSNQMSRYLPLDPRIPVLLTVHDLNFLHEAPQEDRRAEIDRKLADVQRKVDRAAAVVTDSGYVAEELAAHVDLGERPVHVVPLGLDPPPPASLSRPAFLPDGPFLFSVGNCLAHKNFHVLFGLPQAIPGMRLVIAGKKATPYGEHLEREIVRRQLADRVIMPGEISDGDRQWLYEHCEAFLFPSLTEGFGFPVLEAMQAGRPVFCSRMTSLPEVAGSAAFYLDSFEPKPLAEIVRAGLGRFYDDPSMPQRLRDHAASYSWAETARRYCRLYMGLLAERA
jgi:glycosyltransferase involved in cell wall biosynthesis